MHQSKKWPHNISIWPNKSRPLISKFSEFKSPVSGWSSAGRDNSHSPQLHKAKSDLVSSHITDISRQIQGLTFDGTIDDDDMFLQTENVSFCQRVLIAVLDKDGRPARKPGFWVESFEFRVPNRVCFWLRVSGTQRKLGFFWIFFLFESEMTGDVGDTKKGRALDRFVLFFNRSQRGFS